MEHLSTEDILTYLDGKATETEKRALEAHLAVCAKCKEEKRQIHALELRLRIEPSCEPSESAVQSWINLFHERRQPKKPSLGTMIASLIFDSFDQPLLAGVRRVGVPPRQLLYRAGAIDVDFKIDDKGDDECIYLAGQVLPIGPNFHDNVLVRLESGGITRDQVRTNKVGEFSFEVGKDTYDLCIELPEGQITVLNVPPRDSGGQETTSSLRELR